MIISYYGKKFLKRYNEVEKKNLTPKEFFVKIYYPIFFGNEKPLIRVMNSPFNQDNPKAKKNRQIPEGREIILNEFFAKIKEGKIDSCMFVGGYADGLTSTTSFNVSTEYDYIIDENEIYYSWIGCGLSLNLNGINFLFDNDNILYDVYLGWEKYRELISEKLYENYSGKEIAKWNTHWLKNKYDTYPNKKFNPFDDVESYDSKKHILKSTSWVKLLFLISNKYSNEIINTYAYRLDRTNETYGSVVIETKKIGGFLNFCKECFGTNDFLNQPKLYETILGTAYSIEKICELGSIGIVALKPKLFKLEEYHSKTIDNQKKVKKLYGEAVENQFNYKLYNIYLMAKLNIKDIEKDIIEIAESLHKFQEDTRKNCGTLIDSILTTTNMSGFQKNMGEAMQICAQQNLPQYTNVFMKLRTLAISDETKLADLIFSIKFHYYCIECKKNNYLCKK
jgi:hypothetical protein